jgi:hypothetical protein
MRLSTCARRPWLAVVVATVLLCGCAPNPAPPPSNPAGQALVLDLEKLRATDGLFLADTGQDQPGLYNSAYGLSALAAAGAAVRISVDRASLRPAFDSQVADQPLTARTYLAMLEQTLGTSLHEDTDITALQAMLTPQGFFADPSVTGPAAADPGLELSNTASALQALDAFHSALPPAARNAIATWLDTTGQQASTSSLTQRWHLVQADQALGVPLAEGTPDALDKWWNNTGSRLDRPATGDTLVEVCSYIELASTSGVDLSPHRAALERAVDPRVTTAEDPQLDYLIARAWHALDADPTQLAPIVQAITQRRLPSGLLPAATTTSGDLTDSYAVESLRAEAGLAAEDRRLATVLQQRHHTLTDGDPAAEAVWLATVAQADPAHPSLGVDERSRGTIVHALPQPLTSSNVEDWFRIISAMQTLRIPAPPVQIQPWPASTAEQRYAYYLAVIGLHTIGQPSVLPNPSKPESIAIEGISLLRDTPALHLAGAALLAATDLGWHPTPAQRAQILAVLARLHGCPGTPALFRDSPDSSCNVHSTLSAWQIYHALNAIPA